MRQRTVGSNPTLSAKIDRFRQKPVDFYLLAVFPHEKDLNMSVLQPIKKAGKVSAAGKKRRVDAS